MKNKSVKTSKDFALEGMGSLVFDPPPHFFRFKKTQYSSDTTEKFPVLKKFWLINIEKSLFQTKIANFKTVSQCRKCKRGEHSDLFHIQFVAKCRKNEGGHFGDI